MYGKICNNQPECCIRYSGWENKCFKPPVVLKYYPGDEIRRIMFKFENTLNKFKHVARAEYDCCNSFKAGKQ